MPDKAWSSRRMRGTVRQNAGRRRDDLVPDFHDMVENAVEGIIIHRNFKPLYANRAFARMMGHKTVKDVLELPHLRPLVPDDIWARAEEDYDALIKRRVPTLAGRMCAIRKDKSEIWVNINQRLIDWHGEPAVQITAYDIGKQVELEKTLLNNEQHVLAILEVLPYPIYIARRLDGQLLFVNRKTCLLFQRGAGQLLKRSSTEFYADPGERDDLRDLVEKLGDIRDIEVTMQTSQGRKFVAELAAITLVYGGVPAVLVAINDISQRKQMEAELFRQASTDALTGLSNRRYFLAQAEQELRRARRFSREMSVMMIDLDHFKSVNDTYGHATGDIILQGFVKRAQESLRQSDALGRLGGEEFAVLLPETDLGAATEVAERLRQNVADRAFIAGTTTAIQSSVSVGVAQLEARDGTIDDLLNRADEALYRAKNQGRNRVEVASRASRKEGNA